MAAVELFARFNESRDFQESQPEQLDENEFEQASMTQPIPENNIGHQLLVKQGWQAGQGLGKQLQDQVPLGLPPESLTARFTIVVLLL